MAVGAPVALVRAGAINTSSGAINITAGELVISQSGLGAAFTTTGTISIGAGATLDVLGGVFNYDGGSISGDGTLQFSFGVANFTPNFTNTATALELVNATLNGPGTITNATGKTLLLEYSSINAPLVNEGLLKVRGGSANHLGGTLTTTSTSTIRLEADGTFDHAALTMANGFTNQGLIELTSIHGALAATLTVNSGALVNAAGKTIEIEAGTGGPRTINALLNNQGTLQVASTLGLYGEGADHLNSGMIDVTSGDLLINQSGITPSLTTTGTINIAAGSTLEVSGGEFNYTGGSITGAGRLLLSFGTANFTPNFTNATTNLELNFATLNGPGIITNAAGKTLLLQYSNIHAPLVNEGLLKVRGGSNNHLGGALTTVAGSTIRIEADGTFDHAALTVASGFTNQGVIELTSIHGELAATLFVNSGVLVNAAGKTIDVQAGSGGTRSLNAVLDNQGTLQVGASLEIYGSEADHLNSGTIHVTGGNLSVFQSGLTPTFTTSGAIHLAAGRQLEVHAGEFNYSSGAIAGAGRLRFSSATANFTPDFSNATTELELNFATVNGPGTITNAPGKTLLLQYSNVNAPLINAGLLLARGASNNNLGGALTTLAGSTIRVEADGTFDHAALTVANGFTNNGLIELTSINGVLEATLNVATGALLNGVGSTIDAQAGSGGTRNLNVLLENRGMLQVAAPLNIFGSEVDHQNSGTFEITGGDLTIYQFGLTPSFTNTGTINVGLARSLTLQGGSLGNLNAGTLTGGVFNIAGTLRLDGTPITANAATVVLDGVGSRIVDHLDSNLLANLAANTAEGSLTVKGGRNLTVSGGFSNAGTVRIEALSTLATSAGGNYVQSAGVTTLLAASSTLDPAGSANIQGGILSGRGTVAGSVTNSGGTVEPGLSPGLMSVTGDYVQQADGTLDIELAGRAPAGGGAAGVTFDAVSVAGNATLAGKLDLTVLDGFTPVLGDVYPIITASSRSGAFAAVVGTQINTSGLFFDTVYHASGADLVVAGLNAGPDAVREEGQIYELLATFTDTGDENNQTGVIDWGDGSPPVPVVVNHAANTISATHVYGDNGTYTVTLSLASPDGTAASDSLVVTVANANPVIALPAGLSGLEAAEVALGATFSDAGFGTPAGATETFTYTVNWGDGSPLSTGAGQILQVGSAGQPTLGAIGATHIYADNGVYTVTVTVTDDNGGSDSEVFSLTVENVNPTAEVSGPYSVPEGSSVALSAIGSDVADDADPLTFHWDLDNDGDFDDATGPTPIFSAAAIDGLTSPGTARTVRVQVRDSDGGTATASTTVTITNLPPAVNAGGPYTAAEGASVGLVGIGTDAAPADQSMLTFAWDLDNDGDFDDATGPAPSFSAAAIDGLTSPGTVRTVRLRVSDDDGGSSTATTTVTITNAAPTSNAGGPYTVAEGASVILAGTGLDAAPADQAILTFAWDLDNDGDFDDATGPAPSFSAAAIDGLAFPGTVRMVRLRVSDDDGGSSTATTTVTVTNVAPSAEANGPYSVPAGGSVVLSAAGSFDPAMADGASLSYLWDFDNDGVFGELGTAFGDEVGASPTFQASGLLGGTAVLVALRVADDDGGISNSDSATISVNSVGVPTLTIDDVQTTEGDNGAKDLTFTVTLSEASGQAISVNYATANGLGSAAANGLQVTRLASGLANPLFVASAPGDNDRLFIVEQGSSGTASIRVYKRSTGTVNAAPFLTVTGISTNDERGLLGLAFAPDYSASGVFYIYVTNASGHTEVRKHLVSANPDLANASGDLILSFTQPFANHNGGWMGFGPDGYLYIASGDGGSSYDPGNNGQSLNTLLGKILRIDPSSDDFPGDGSRDYSIPAGNPFATDGDPATLAEIWHYGLRNPWRASFDRSTGDFYIADVGQGIREEVNVQPVGHPGGMNFGWRPREGTQATPNVGGAKPAGAIDPIYEYSHGGGANQGNAVTGGYVYRGPIAELGGSYFFADFVNSRIWSLRYDGSDPAEHDGTNFAQFTDWTNLLAPNAGSIQSIASFGEDNQGNLLIVDHGGEIFEITSGGDYLPQAGQLTFAPGQTTQTITVKVLGDVLDEPNESFVVNLTNAVGGGAVIGDSQGSGTIVDNDNLPVVRLNGPASVTEADSFFEVYFEVSLANPSSVPVVVEVIATDGTANGTDYQLLGPTTLIFHPGETFKRVAVRVLGDQAFERAEQFRLSLQSATNATIDAAASLIDVTIQNDDAAPILTVLGGSTSEGNLAAEDQSIEFLLLLSGVSGVEIAGTLSLTNGTAELGSDFESLASTSFVIPAGSVQSAVQVPIREDLVIEGDESFTLTATVTDLTTITTAGSTLAATGTIENDDFACGLVVTTTADSGSGSLRAAILCANETAGTDTITFAIPGPGVQTIVLASALPEIVDGVVIDGFSQPGSEINFDSTGVGGDIRIALSGGAAGANANGLALVAGSAGSTVSGLAIHGFSGSGIFVASSDNYIHHNIIGTNAAGATAVPNRNGVEIVGGNVGIDCDEVADCGNRNRLANNLISGNGGGTIITVDGTDMPWLFGQGLNEGFEYGFGFPQNAGTAPTIVPVTAGTTVTVSYVSGLINAFLDVDPTVDGRGYSGDLDPVPFATNDLDNFPSAYLNPGETHFLLSLVGVFANSAGQIVGQPFAIRNGQLSAEVPAGATRLQLGVNDDLYFDNSGALQVRITGDSDFGAGHGVLVRGLAAENALTNNFIGTDITGTAAIANSRNGVSLYDGANHNAIGLPGGGELPRQGNLISGNIEHGVDIAFGSSTNTVQGNHIGTDRDGFSRLGNGRQGVLINQGFAESAGPSDNLIGSDDDGFIDDLEGNLISANGEDGIRIEGSETSGNRVAGNRIGTDVSGGFDLGNRNYGIVVIRAAGNTLGGLASSAGNLISGNDYSGIGIFQGAAENTIVGNRIGTDATGLTAIGNADYGITIESSPGNVIGGNVAAAGNVISGNGWVGVSIFGEGATDNRLQGNYIGVDASGNGSLANDGGGIVISGSAGNLVGGDTAAVRNVIAGNLGDGVAIFGEDAGSNRIQGNWIGLAADGVTALGNSGLGVGIFDANDTLIGGSTAAIANIIAHNGGEGVFVDGGARNTIRGNSIYANGRLGINLFTESDTDATHRVTPNDLDDSDIGSNDLYNFPVLEAASINAGNLVVAGLAGGGALVELFLSEADPSGFGEGREFLAAFVEGSVADSDPVAGRFRFSLPVPAHVSQGVGLTATATSSSGSTSEFSANLAVAIPAFSISDVDQSEGGSGLTEFTFTVSLNNPPAEPVSVVLNTANGTATTSGTSNSGGDDYVAVSGQLLTFVPGGPLTQTFTVLVNGDATFEGDEHFFLLLSNPTGGAAILDGQGRGEIRNDDARPTVSINDRSVFETDGGFFSVYFDITLSNPSAEPVSLGVLSADGTATTADGDYTLTSVSPFTFNPGITALQTAVQINGDAKYETDETFFVNLTLLSGATASGSDLQALGTIRNDDLAPTLSIFSSSMLEGNPGDDRVVAFTLSLSAISGVDVTGTLAVASNGPALAGIDFVDISGQLFSIPAGQTQVVVQVPIVEDLDIEGDETFPLTATVTDASVISNSGGIASGSGTILNDDFAAPSFTIDDVSIAETNAGTTVATFTVTLSGTVTGPVAVTVQTANNSATVADGDYLAVAPTILNFAAAGSQTVSITVNGDLKFELDESYFVNLSNPTGGAVIADGQGLGTIRNDDVQPSISLGDFNAAEGNAGTTPFSFAVTLTNPSYQDIRIDYQTADGTAAAADGDYLPATSFLMIPAGETTGSIAIQVSGDNIVEADQDFFVNVTGVGPAASVGDGQGRGVIENDDATPLVSLVINPNDGLESVGAVLALIQLDRPSDFPIQVLLSTSDGTALAADGDYDTHSQTYVVPPRQTTLQLTLTGMVNDDAKFELDESFILSLSAPVNAAIAQRLATYTIRNDDAQPAISINDVTLSEGNGGTTAFVFTVSLSNPSYLAVSANFATGDGTATLADGDYASASGVVSVPAGSLSQSITVQVGGDATVETDEQFFVNLNGAVNGSLAVSQGSGTILNDDFTTPTFTIDDVTLEEGHGGTTAYVFTVSLSQAPAGNVSVTATTADGTATTADSDYSSHSQLLTFTPNQLTQAFTVLVNGDNKFEVGQEFFVNLTGASGGTLIGDSQGRGLIRNDDSRPTIGINHREVLEGGEGSSLDVLFEVTLSNPSDETVTVTMNTADGTASIADGDYQAVVGRTITFTPLQTSQTIAVRIFGDAKFELDESFFANLTSPSNGTIGVGQGQGTITNDDAQPTISINDVTLSEGNGGTTAFVFTVSLSNPSYQVISANFATADGTATVADSDYVSASGLVSIATGSTMQTITVQVTGDNKFEFDDALLVNLTNPANAMLADSQGEGSIANDDAQPTISINDVTLSEGNSGTTDLVFTVSLSNPSILAVSANFAAADGTATLANNDYVSNSGLVTIAAGATTQTITVQVVGDTSIELDEQFFVNLSGAVNGSLAVSQGSGTIVNDDFTIPTFSIEDVSLDEGHGGTTAYVFTVSLSQAPAGSVSVTATTADGTATTADSDYSGHSQFLSFTPNQLTQTFTVLVNGDTKFEVDQDFFVNLTGASAGTLIGDSQGRGLIRNDDSQPTVTISDVTLSEGNSGTTAFVFSIGLSNPSEQDIRIDFQTADGTAKVADSDYQAKTDFLVIPAGTTTGSLTIQVLGDTTQEPDEDFFVNLTAAGPGATVGDNQARGLIVNDDAGLPPLSPTVVGDDQTAVYRERGVWTSGPTGVGYQGDSRMTPAGAGTKSATWKLPKLASGLYEVFATWPAAATAVLNDARAEDAAFAIFDGATPRGSGVANQRLLPNDGSYDGAAWESLGFFVINSGVLVIQLSDQANGTVIADGVLAVRAGEGEPAAAVPGVLNGATDEVLTPLVSLDASNDGRVTALDALKVINYLNAGLTTLPGASGLGGEASIDINADQVITARDALHVINHLNAFTDEKLDREAAADAVFADLEGAVGNAADYVLGELLASGTGGRRLRRR